MRVDHRPVSEQIKSGVLISIKILVAFAIAVVFMAGCVLIGKAYNWHQAAAGWLLASVSIVLMATTVRFWAAGFFGFVGYGALRSLGGVFVADVFHVSREYMLLVSMSLIVMAVLSHRFVSKHLQLTVIDCASLVIAASCVLITFLLGDTYKGFFVFNLGNLVLLISWWKARLAKQNRHKSHRHTAVST
jgi:hypothetical protein